MVLSNYLFFQFCDSNKDLQEAIENIALQLFLVLVAPVIFSPTVCYMLYYKQLTLDFPKPL